MSEKIQQMAESKVVRWIREMLRRIRADPSLLRQLYGITLVCALFLASFVIKSGLESGKYIVDGSGNVTGIQRRSLNSYEEYPLRVRIQGKDEVLEKEVIISKRSLKEMEESRNAGKKDRRKEVKQNREMELGRILSDIESSAGKKIDFPSELSDGSPITWQKGDPGRSEELAILGMYCLLVGMALYSRLAPRKKKKGDDGLLRGLPRFVNQLVMMLYAGVILSDAFDRICQSYSMIPAEARSDFENEMVELYRGHRDHRVSTAMLLNHFAGMHNVKEMLRISTILLENERRGSDVVESLSRESRFLWEERKIVAAEKGKAIDTKMAGPLGLLLILLIVVTMAPAILVM